MLFNMIHSNTEWQICALMTGYMSWGNKNKRKRELIRPANTLFKLEYAR